MEATRNYGVRIGLTVSVGQASELLELPKREQGWVQQE